jgi:hypothetical protein
MTLTVTRTSFHEQSDHPNGEAIRGSGLARRESFRQMNARCAIEDFIMDSTDLQLQE